MIVWGKVNFLQVIQVYLDQPLLGGFLGWLQDGALLWMVSQIGAARVRFHRLILGGLIGGLFQFLLEINIATGGIVNPWILTPGVYLLLVPALMVMVAFFPVPFRRFLRILGYVYLLSFLLSGFHWGIDILNQRFFHWEIALWWRFLMHLTLILLLGELGWGVVHRKVWERICLYPIEINWAGHGIRLNALLDTGNRLHDPLTQVPVIIVELARIKDELPPQLVGLVESIQVGELGAEIAEQLPEAWEERIRILPFHSLGKEHGILVGFRPDELKVWEHQQMVTNQNVVVGLYNSSLSREGAFQALIPPAVLQN